MVIIILGEKLLDDCIVCYYITLHELIQALCLWSWRFIAMPEIWLLYGAISIRFDPNAGLNLRTKNETWLLWVKNFNYFISGYLSICCDHKNSEYYNLDPWEQESTEAWHRQSRSERRKFRYHSQPLFRYVWIRNYVCISLSTASIGNFLLQTL